MGSSSSPSGGGSGGNGSEKEGDSSRPRFFNTKAKSICWAKAETVPGRHPERWRKDAADNVVCKRFFNCLGCLCFEYDHIIPYSKGGESVAENCQILQSRVNRFKSNKDEVDTTQLKGYSCDIKFTAADIYILLYTQYSITFPDLDDRDPCEFAAHADRRLGVRLLHAGRQPIYKELDIIEMAVYGDVIRPGNQCRCRTVAEMLGKYKSKDSTEACKLPQGSESL